MADPDFVATQWQREIYLNGFAGRVPSVPIDYGKLEREAKANMSKQAFAYIAGGAGNEHTMANNREALQRCKIIPRMLRKVDERDTQVELFGQKIPFPILLSPIGVLEMVNKKADLAVGRAAAKVGLPFIFSNQASVPMEKVAEAMGDSPRWFQLYWSKSNDLVASFVRRAENCGCSAIVLTLDTTMLGWRTRDLDVAYLPFLEGKGIAQYTSDPVFQKLLDEDKQVPDGKRTVTLQSIGGLFKMVNNYPGGGFVGKLLSGRPVKAVQKFISIYSNPALQWDNLKFLRDLTRLPILLKGILHPDDAATAAGIGINGIIVSNHGGRQVDGAIGSFEALPAIVKAVNGKIPVLIDSGVRGGADIFKAIALGARAVCVGRPYAYGLAVAGEKGVYEVLRNYTADFELTMGLAGCRNLGEITADCLIRG